MIPIEIVIYNHENKCNAPYRMVVNAFCAGGKEGVFAVFRMPTNQKLIGIACGDDGHWQLMNIYQEDWCNKIIKAMTEITKQ